MSLALILGAAALLAVLALTRPRQQSAPDTAPADIPPFLPPRNYVCYRASGPIEIDGRLDKAAWQAVPWTEDFVDIEGDKKPKPRFRTRAKLLWDDQFFYIAAELEEPDVWGYLDKHDSYIFRDDPDFEVFIDPNGDNHEYYEFEINALNTGWDLLLTKPYKDGGKPVDSWEIPGLKTAVHVDGTHNIPGDTDRGWTVEMAFPWKVLGELAYEPTPHRTPMPAPPRNGDQWRVNFSRVEWAFDFANGRYKKKPNAREDNWVWSPQGVINMHRPETWGYVQFSTARPGTDAFHPDPAGKTKHLLHVVYYRQHEFRREHGHWARSLEDLNLKGIEREEDAIARFTMETTSDLFQVNAQLLLPDGNVQTWHIREDARVWRDD